MEAQPKQLPVYEQYVDEIVENFAKEMKQELGLICIGDGGRMPSDVQEISVKFIAYRSATVEEARDIEVKATERLLKLINSHEKIRPYLREYPFKPFRAQISIGFRKKSNAYFTDGSVTLVFQVKDKIFYRSADPKTDQLVDLAQEPYEEALQIVQQSSSSIGTPHNHEKI